MAVPDGAEPEDQLLVVKRPSLAQDRLRVPEHQDPGAGREPALRPRQLRRTVLASHRRVVQQPLQPRRLHAGPALDLCAQQHLGRRPRAEHALPVSAGRLARERSPDPQCRPALRICHAVGGRAQRAVELQPGHQVDGAGQGRVADRSLNDQPGPQQFRPARRHGLHADTAHRGARRLGHQLRALSPCRWRQRAAD